MQSCAAFLQEDRFLPIGQMAYCIAGYPHINLLVSSHSTLDIVGTFTVEEKTSA